METGKRNEGDYYIYINGGDGCRKYIPSFFLLLKC